MLEGYKIETFTHYSGFYNEQRNGSLLTKRKIASHIRVIGDCATEKEAIQKAKDYAEKNGISILE